MTLLMRDIENMEKGELYGAISICRDIGLSDYKISKKIQEKYNLTSNEADSYMKGRKI